MEVKKIMSIINKKNRVIGFIQEEKYSNDLIIFTVDTKSIGMSFNELSEAIDYVKKINYSLK